MTRPYNFCAGPATIPEAVMKRAQKELLDWQGRGTSVMEISHRSPDFMKHVLTPARENLKKLLNIPDNYHVLFITAGTSHQFAMVPMNLLNLNPNNTADYFYTGTWSGKAINEAKKYGDIRIALSTEETGFKKMPNTHTPFQVNKEAAFVHYTPNETIHGFQFHEIPETDSIPLVADMSSEILSRPLEVSRFGLIYAGTQKNIGPSGLTLVILREDLVGYAKKFTPTLYNYKTYIESDSLYHTPNTFAIYMAGCVFEWILAQGGLAAMEFINQRKAEMLYKTIDHSGFYMNKVDASNRSRMNVIFNLPSAELDAMFVQEAQQHQLLNLKGHKAIGGIRASIYNAMPLEGVMALVEFMKSFEKKYG